MQTTSFQEWVKGIPYELAFWNNLYRWDKTFEGVINWSRRGQALLLEGMNVQEFLSNFEHPIVLDVGCGITYAKGDQRVTPNGLEPLDVRYLDPLAPFYNEIIRRHHRSMPAIQFGMMEHLSASIEPGTATLVIIQNALDHSSDPLRGILSALQVLRIGGCLYLQHHPNEAEAENYKGFHQFNICTDEQQHCCIWNKETNVIVDNVIAPFATIRTLTLDNGFVVSIITKTGEVPLRLASSAKDNIELGQMVESQLYSSMDLQFALAQKLRYWWYNTIHFFVQGMPSEWRQQLRRVIYKE
ncbi:MAG: hypothetical protein K6A32_03005 [Bacteroidales bacterium]|nr:hypothetical protein [Bacteroidales bacterium]